MRILYRPLWEGMQVALRDIFLNGHMADKVIQRQLKSNRKWGSHDRRLFAEGLYDMVRWWRKLLYACDVAWPEEDKWHSGDAEVLQRVIAAWCAIHNVELDRSLESFKVKAGQVLDRWNAPDLPDAIRESLPDWLEEWGRSQLGDRWAQTMRALNTSAPVYLRANRLKTDATKLQALLQKERVDLEWIEGDCLRLKARSNVFLTPAFQNGLFEVQDLHSQRVSRLLAPEPGMRVIDACAGAGGKSLHLASLMRNKGKIISLDVVEDKLQQLRLRSKRGGASCIEDRWIESSKVVKRLAESADRLLLDVPCSGMGVIRRNPDAKWRLTRAEVDELMWTQRSILASYSNMCKVGGVMVYATCSVMPAENQDQVDLFMSQNENKWKLLMSETWWPQIDGGDGFFVAQFERI